ncbi:hypothetical protein P691DRAFT_788362 [Macrolepiota fuliginosa MF-IS2]|uniref:Uncharacterized protein n=1 Tax=Macrolepiota fuliginosa MF-IS2 TaxID=1400762 RepID=A0A9P5XJR5_9AGAR|nr:hypothetical protein P691DRAFT_788362 [Macrolepiota fuliginosa MF-IS2]
MTFINRASFLDDPFHHSLNEYISAYMQAGVLLVLSFVASILLIKNKSNHWQWLLAAGAVMLAIATADLILGYYILFSRVLRGQLALPFRFFYPKYFLYVTNNIIADCLVIYRCYMIWGRDKRVIALPVIVLLATSGRIWWISRKPQLNVGLVQIVEGRHAMFTTQYNWYDRDPSQILQGGDGGDSGGVPSSPDAVLKDGEQIAVETQEA